MDCDDGPVDLEINGVLPESDPISPLIGPLDTFNDIPPMTEDNIGVENTWKDEQVAIPLPPPPSPLLMIEYNTEDATPFTDDLGIFSPADTTTGDPAEDLFANGGKGEPGVCGLRNLGNTCFMSAGVQSLMATAPIVVSLIRTPIPPQHALAKRLAELTKMVWTSKNSVICPTEFKESLVTHFPQFNDYRQHDCQEFLALLLDGLHEQMNTATKKVTNVGCDGRDSPISSCKKLAQLHEQFHPSTSQSDCDRITKNDFSEAMGPESEVACKDVAYPVITSLSSPEMNNALNSKFRPRKEKSETLSCDNQLNNIFPSSNLGDGVHVMNNSLPQLSRMEDILKVTAKTSNINVLVEQEEANNEIRFDSEKYPRIDNPRRRGEQFNLNSFHLYENNTGGKRGKSSVTYYSSAADFKEGLDMKRVKLNSDVDEQDEKNKKMELERRNKTGEPMVLEKNQRLECERLETEEASNKVKDVEMSLSPENGTSDLKESKTSDEVAVDNQGEAHWRTHLAANRSVIVDTFQGQFKSTVVCSTCNFVSVTYEPFMYLSVPLPNALQRHLMVTFMSGTSNEPTVCSLQVNQYDTIGTLKHQLMDKIDCDRSINVTMTEVLNNHISKILDDSFLIRHLNDSDRRLYAFEIVLPAVVERVQDNLDEEEVAVNNSCAICLEDKPNLKQHEECSCKLCEQCISASCQHSTGSNFKCPFCMEEIHPDSDMVPVRNDLQLAVRMINIPVVFRVDKIGDGNNQKSVELFGHPRLLRVPSTIPSETLHGLLNRFLPCPDNYKVLLVDGKGHNCSRCMYTVHCRGCAVRDEGDVDLTTSDTLAIAYTSPVTFDMDSYRAEMAVTSPPKPLTLYDCIQAFSKSEQLDGNNPWFCPQCQENRCATKTLTVWRCPDYLIVYLKRFVFRNNISTKLEEKVIFPLTGLSLPTSDSLYDLYACVCHVGGVSAGHYTSYAQHPYTAQWHHFNDSLVNNQQPQEEDYHNAYILFYQKQGIEVPALSNEDVANNLE